MANHEGRPEYGGSFATARAGADHPCTAQKSGISRKNSDARSRPLILGLVRQRDLQPDRLGNHSETFAARRDRQHPAQPPWGCPIDPLSAQAAAACLNAEDAGLNPAITGNSSPPLAGNVGSETFEIPCSRIHRTCASTAAAGRPALVAA